MKLYCYALSSNARKAVMAALLLDSPVELIKVDLAKGEQRTPEYLKLNPNGKVPTLVDGNLVLWESLAIMTYLADKQGDTTYYPKELTARADVNRWLFWSAAHLAPAIAVLNFENVLKKRLNLGAPDEARVKQASSEVAAFGKILDGQLEGREWLSGSSVTFADVAVACPLMITKQAKLPTQGLPNVERWFGQIQSLDAWVQTEPRL